MQKGFYKKIIVAINGHTSSIHAAMYAIMMARSYHISIKFVYVVDSATLKYLSMNRFLMTDEKTDYEERLTKDGSHYLAYVENLASTKGLKVETELRNGGVFTEILKAADEYNADLIILGGNEKTSDNSGYKRRVLSIDQSEVLANSKCPVLIVQKPDISDAFKVF